MALGLTIPEIAAVLVIQINLHFFLAKNGKAQQNNTRNFTF